MKNIAVLGSTGSIGTQAAQVAQRISGSIRVTALSAHRSGEALAEQARALGAGRACLTDPQAAARYAGLFSEMGIDLHAGPDGLLEMIGAEPYDLVLNSVVGSGGLAPTCAVLEKGITLALANKESLVAGGRLVMSTAESAGARIIPVDSEHSAIFQCLAGQDPAGLRRIILTASGGPFKDTPADELEAVTVEETLAHPTWSMGRKVTVDSATLMNKGLEVLEAHHLFSVDLDSVDVVVHPQSIVHSMIEMVDGSVLAQLGVPDMRIPIQYALTYPDRTPSPAPFLSLARRGDLTFQEADFERFPCLRLAYQAGRKGATYPAAMNAANEEAVSAFLEGRIRLTDIPVVVERVLEGHRPLHGDTLEEIVTAEGEARGLARGVIDGLGVTP